jgi:hypothetical protein
MTDFTRIQRKFEYHVEDVACPDCLHYKHRTKANPHGCGFGVCPYEDIRQDAIANGRFKRPKGYFRCPE